MKQWHYYETIALFMLFDKRLGKVRHVYSDVESSLKRCTDISSRESSSLTFNHWVVNHADN